MKLPRNLSGADLIKALKVLSYSVTRQAGSHIRLTTEMNGTHHITIPNHDPLKVRNLSAILGDIALHFNKSKEDLIQLLWK